MPRRFVRESKFRHVFGEPYKRALCYENINVTRNTWDGGNYCATNSNYVAMVLDNAGGGQFIVIPVDKTGRLEQNMPRFSGHKSSILDIQFNPFNANIVATASEDSRIKIWNVPDESFTSDVTESVIDLVGHRKKVGIIQWHPAAENVLASAGFDCDLIIWDVQRGTPVHVISCHDDIINAMQWNASGSLLATTSKDKMARIIDPRNKQVLHKFSAHDGTKPSRIFFIDDNRILTVGTARDTTREIKLWNKNNFDEPITKTELDQGSGNILASFDNALNILYVAAKGECFIRYWEISKESPYIHYLSQYSSTTPQRCLGVLPKNALKVDNCEIFRLYKVHSKGMVEPVSMVVPRKSDSYQADIYPDIPGDEPALSAEQWLNGQDDLPLLISLQKAFTAKKKQFTPVQQKKVDENIFELHLEAPKREDDLRKAYYKQQEEIKKLQEMLKEKELKIGQLEYQVSQANKNQQKEEKSEENTETIEVTKVSKEQVTEIAEAVTEMSEAVAEVTQEIVKEETTEVVEQESIESTKQNDEAANEAEVTEENNNNVEES